MIFLMNKKILVVAILVVYSLFLWSTLNSYLKFKEQKELRRINVSLLENLSKEEIIEYIKVRQSERAPGNFINVLLPISLGSLLVGMLTMYIMLEKVEKVKRNTDIILRLLPKEEREIIRELLHKDFLFQSEISQKIGKLRAHRIIQKLEERGVIEKARYGKTNIIRLKKDIRENL